MNKKEKPCIYCKKVLPISEYCERPNYNRTTTIYYKSQCNQCEVKLVEKWRLKNLKKFRIYQNKWHKNYRRINKKNHEK